MSRVAGITDAEGTDGRSSPRPTGLVAGAFAAVAALAVAAPMAVIALSDRGSASFGDQETVGRNRLGAATVDLEVGDATVPLRADGLAPGDLVVGEIEFVNVGTVPVRYALTVATVDAGRLGPWLSWQFRPRAGGDVCPSDDEWRAGVDGAVRVDGARVTETGTVVLGDPAPGPDDGDRVLDVGSSERLCVAVTVAIGAPNAVQSSTTSVRITAHGEQLGADESIDLVDPVQGAAP